MTLHPYLADSPKPRIIAHRGFTSPEAARNGLIENTRAAFASALTHGATHLETDCHLTRDGKVVLFHDIDLTRITSENVRVADLTHAELTDRMVDRGGLITLDEALDEFAHARFNVDVKVAAAAQLAGQIIAPHAHRVLLTSFADVVRKRALAAALELSPVRPAASPGKSRMIGLLTALATRSERPIARALSGLDALQVPERFGRLRVLSPRLIDAAHRYGVEVHVWTVNDPARMRSLVDAGVDGIVTDRTDLAVAEFTR